MTLYTYPLIDIQGPTGPTGPTGAQGFVGSLGAGYTGSASTVAGPTGPTGEAGVVGYRGSQGVEGYTGSLGFTGSAGESGLAGYRGSQGVAGYTGSRGDLGFTGSAGTAGFAGSEGFRGFTGFTGSRGAVGFTGSAGVDGFVGSEGFRGFTGFTGSKGEIGFTGSRGEGGQGYTGSASTAVGTPGYAGSRGAVGFTGSKGDGGTGYTGSSGAFAAIGYTGSSGFTGSSGAFAAIGYTGSSGAFAAIGYTGSSGAFSAIGYTGSSGAFAALGYTGSTGFTGSSGSFAAIGYTGSSGAFAAIGYTGSSGAFAAIGYTGSSGAFAAIGYAGSSGLQGATGYTGSRGIDAVAGYRGSQGVEGYTGSRGPTGYTGSIGFTGSVGYTGSRGDVGFTGSIGFTGSQGAGFTGSVGYVGSRGYTGSVGYTGSEGIRGQKGDVGYTGSLGLGTVGYTGSRGVLGYTGSQGPSGTGGFSAIPSSTALTPGFPLAVDANTGLFGNTDDIIGISTGGDARVTITNTSTTFTNTTLDSSTVIEGGIGIFRIASGVTQVAINRNVDSGTTNGLVLNSDGNLEIIRSAGGAYIDFKTLATANYDFRIRQDSTNAKLEFLSSAGSAAILDNTTLFLNGSLNTSYLSVRRADPTGAPNDGGRLQLEQAGDSTLAGAAVYIDTITNRLRILESGSPFKGVYLDITGCADNAQSALLHSSNFSTYLNGSYVLKTGDTITGALQVNGQLSTSALLLSGTIDSPMAQNNAVAGLEVRNASGLVVDTAKNSTLAAIRFHIPGAWGVKLGLRQDGVIGIGGWTADPWRWYVNTANGDMTAAGNVVAYSDARLKTNVVTITHALDLVDQMRGVTFTRTDTGEAGVGVIAQELQQVLPELVTVGEDGDTLGVSYGNLTGVLIEAVKSLHEQNKLLTQRVDQAYELIHNLYQKLK